MALWEPIIGLWASQENNALQLVNQSTCYIGYKHKPYNNIITITVIIIIIIIIMMIIIIIMITIKILNN